MKIADNRIFLSAIDSIVSGYGGLLKQAIAFALIIIAVWWVIKVIVERGEDATNSFTSWIARRQARSKRSFAVREAKKKNREMKGLVAEMHRRASWDKQYIETNGKSQSAADRRYTGTVSLLTMLLSPGLLLFQGITQALSIGFLWKDGDRHAPAWMYEDEITNLYNPADETQGLSGGVFRRYRLSLFIYAVAYALMRAGGEHISNSLLDAIPVTIGITLALRLLEMLVRPLQLILAGMTHKAAVIRAYPCDGTALADGDEKLFISCVKRQYDEAPVPTWGCEPENIAIEGYEPSLCYARDALSLYLSEVDHRIEDGLAGWGIRKAVRQEGITIPDKDTRERLFYDEAMTGFQRGTLYASDMWMAIYPWDISDIAGVQKARWVDYMHKIYEPLEKFPAFAGGNYLDPESVTKLKDKVQKRIEEYRDVYENGEDRFPKGGWTEFMKKETPWVQSNKNYEKAYDAYMKLANVGTLALKASGRFGHAIIRPDKTADRQAMLETTTIRNGIIRSVDSVLWETKGLINSSNGMVNGFPYDVEMDNTRFYDDYVKGNHLMTIDQKALVTAVRDEHPEQTLFLMSNPHELRPADVPYRSLEIIREENRTEDRPNTETENEKENKKNIAINTEPISQEEMYDILTLGSPKKSRKNTNDFLI